MMSILILGSNGTLGQNICNELKKNNINFFAQSRSKKNKYFCDFNNEKSFLRLLNKVKPKIVINTISNINVEECEKNFERCFKDNILTAHIISKICGEKKIKQIYISTDQVYSSKGYSKEENVNPINNYGKSKIIEENFVLKNKGVVLRVNFIHKDKKKRAFHDSVVFSNLKKVNLFNNILFNPLHVSTLSMIIVSNLNKFKKGIFNIGAKNKISKEIFILKLCKILKIKKNFNSVKYLPTLIPRPLDMTMNINKTSRLLRIKKYDIKEEINKLANEYK
jgi:dTDP-4-dehydrorhamnose reductase